LFVTQFAFTDETIRLIYAFIYIALALAIFIRDIPTLGTFTRAVRRTLKDPAGVHAGDLALDKEHPP
jgi:hypothetical protein